MPPTPPRTIPCRAIQALGFHRNDRFQYCVVTGSYYYYPSFSTVSGQRTEKLFSMGFEILGFAISFVSLNVHVSPLNLVSYLRPSFQHCRLIFAYRSPSKV